MNRDDPYWNIRPRTATKLWEFPGYLPTPEPPAAGPWRDRLDAAERERDQARDDATRIAAQLAAVTRERDTLARDLQQARSALAAQTVISDYYRSQSRPPDA